eukprot:s2430_g9.t1
MTSCKRCAFARAFNPPTWGKQLKLQCRDELWMDFLRASSGCHKILRLVGLRRRLASAGYAQDLCHRPSAEAVACSRAQQCISTCLCSVACEWLAHVWLLQVEFPSRFSLAWSSILRPPVDEHDLNLLGNGASELL